MWEKECNNEKRDYNPNFSIAYGSFAEQDPKRRSCEEKTSYDTDLDAYHAAQRRNRDLPVRYSDLGHYNCLYCDRWHVGHSNNGDLRSKKAIRLYLAFADICRILPMAS